MLELLQPRQPGYNSLPFLQGTLVGVMLPRPRGILQDYVYARMWGNIVSSNGSESGVELRDLVAKQMTPARIEDALELARECVRKKYKGC